MGCEALVQVLHPLENLFHKEEYPNLLVGLESSDDAAVFRINDGVAVIQTLDFFPPIVDNPYNYGAIAAANSMSDIYAMGGEVLLALNICCFPHDLPTEIISEILRGGAEKVREGGGVIAGGHTLIDKEPKYGLSVMGIVHPNHITSKSNARPGDVLVLTKALGTGVITTAAKKGDVRPEHLQNAIEGMLILNRQAASLIQEMGIKACTDITGFGLLGHAYEMAVASNVGMHFTARDIPLLDGAVGYVSKGYIPGGGQRNSRYLVDKVDLSVDIPKEINYLLHDPQTSGGLLISVPSKKLNSLLSIFAESGQKCWVIGKVTKKKEIKIE